MDSTINTENGMITVKYIPKHYSFEMLALDGYDDIKILYVEYSSDFYRLEDKLKIEKLFLELEPQIIQIMKFYVNENVEFYKHFDIDFTLMGDSLSFVSKELFNSNYLCLNWDRYVKSELRAESLQYLKGLTEKQKNVLRMI